MKILGGAVKTSLILQVMFFLWSLKSCKSMDTSFSLEVPKEGFEVIQQIPSSQKGREKNALYLSPRRIRDDEFNTPALKTLVDSMYTMMIRKSGVGIAANQIGKRLQIFIIEAKPNNPRYKVLGPVPMKVFINPRITQVSTTRKNFWHGCLSAAGEKRGNVATYEWLDYQCQNEKGEIETGRLEGFAAVIFQHEFRHLMSGTYLDVSKQYLSKNELDIEIEAGRIPFFEMVGDSLPLLIQGYVIGQTLDEYHATLK